MVSEVSWCPTLGETGEHLVKLVFGRAAAGAAAVGRRSMFSASGPQRLAAATLRRSKTSKTGVCPLPLRNVGLGLSAQYGNSSEVKTLFAYSDEGGQ